MSTVKICISVDERTAKLFKVLGASKFVAKCVRPYYTNLCIRMIFEEFEEYDDDVDNLYQLRDILDEYNEQLGWSNHPVYKKHFEEAKDMVYDLISSGCDI